MLRPAVTTDRRLTSPQQSLNQDTDANALDNGATSLSNRPAPATKTEDQTTGEQLAHQTTTTDALLQRQTHLELLAQSPTTAEQLQQTVIGTAVAFMQTDGVSAEPSLFLQDPFNLAAQTAIGATLVSTTAVQPASTDEAPLAFIGEPPVDESWLATRNELLDDVSADYQQQLQAAQDNHGGPGWNSSVRTATEQGGEQTVVEQRVGIRAPNGEILSLDSAQALTRERGGEYVLRDGFEYVTEEIIDWQFSEQDFQAHYLQQPNAQLNTLASHYEQPSSNALLDRHPDLFDIALRADRPANSGPGLDGTAMASTEDLTLIDITLLDPDVQALIDADTSPIELPDNSIARAQINYYGEVRFEQMQRYSRAMESVRTDYRNAVEAAQNDPDHSGAGWSTVEVTQGKPEDHYTYHEFSVDEFSEWYIAQDNPSARLFATFYGPANTVQTNEHPELSLIHISEPTRPY